MFDSEGERPATPSLIQVYQTRERAKERRRQVGNLVALAGMAMCVAAIPGLLFLQSFLAERAERKAWTIIGPSCPIVAAPSPRATSHVRKPMTHVYGGASFTRSFGAVSCAGFRQAALFGESRITHICQFNNPGAVVVKTPRATTTFEAEPGRRLTVTVREGKASCVVGGWFNLR